LARGRSALRVYPNWFDLHAVYRAGTGEWTHKRLISGARVRFVGVKERTADAAVLELRPNRIHTLEEAKQARKDGREINKPFTLRLIAREGARVIGDKDAERDGVTAFASRRP